MRQPSLKNLHYLIELRKTLHFAKAAQHCFVSQSTLSAGIAKLEQDLQVVLVERNNKHVVFTSMGERIVAQAELIMTQMQDLKSMATVDFFSSEITIGVIPTISAYILPGFLHQVGQHYPQLKPSFIEDTSDNLLRQLENNTIDFAIFAFPYDLPEGIESYELFIDDLCLVRHQDNAAHVIGEHELLLLEQGHCLRSHVMQGYQINEKQISKISCSSIATMVAMIDLNLGMSFLPRMAIDFGVLEPYHHLIVQSSCKASRRIGIVYRKSNPQKSHIQQLAKASLT